MSFRIRGLSPEPFQPLFGLSEAELGERGAKRYRVDESPGYPDRIELEDAPVGATVLLVNYVHQPAATPYRASHAIFVREGATRTYDRVAEIPEVLRRRTISLRAFDTEHLMRDADLVEGTDLRHAIERFLADPAIAYLHAHYAKRGCYAARIDRA